MGVKKRSLNEQKAELEKKVFALRPVASPEVIAKLTAKPKKGKLRKLAKRTTPQVVEEPKQLLCFRGHKCSALGQRLLKDLCVSRAPLAVNYTRRNSDLLVAPMEDPKMFCFLPVKSHCSLFAMASTTKKRPLRLYLGRTFDEQLYDVYEFDVVKHSQLATGKGEAPVVGSKPLVLFMGSLWETSTELKGAQNILADIFGGVKAERIAADKFDHAYVCTIYEGTTSSASGLKEPLIKVDHFYLKLKKNDDKPNMPHVELKDIGPGMILKLGRAHLPSDDLAKRALRIPPEEWEKGSKKTTTNALLEKEQRLHINTQSFRDLRMRHGASSKKRKTDSGEAAASAATDDE